MYRSVNNIWNSSAQSIRDVIKKTHAERERERVFKQLDGKHYSDRFGYATLLQSMALIDWINGSDILSANEFDLRTRETKIDKENQPKDECQSKFVC